MSPAAPALRVLVPELLLRVESTKGEAMMTDEQRDEVTTLVGNALTALDDPAGVELEFEQVRERIAYAVANLSGALPILEPETYA